MRRVTEQHLRGRQCISRGNRLRAYESGLRWVWPGVYFILKLAGVEITKVQQGLGWGRRDMVHGGFTQKGRKMVYSNWAPRTAVLLANLLHMASREGEESGAGGKGVWKDRATILRAMFGETMKMVSINLGMDPNPVLLEMAERFGISKITCAETIADAIARTDGYF